MTQLYTPYDQSGNEQTTILTAYFMGGAYEVSGTIVNSTLTESGSIKYYSLAGQMIAMRDSSDSTGLKYLLTDHLGSVVAVTDAGGTLVSQQRYLPFGEVRSDLNPPYITQTDFGYTGQRALSGMGLYDYRARAYDPLLMRFISPDSRVPGSGSQAYNRYAYVNNSPINNSDPTGHVIQGRCNYLKNYNCETPGWAKESGSDGANSQTDEGDSDTDITEWLFNEFGLQVKYLRENWSCPNNLSGAQCFSFLYLSHLELFNGDKRYDIKQIMYV